MYLHMADVLYMTYPGWRLGHPSEKYEFVNWDDEIPNINGKIKLMATKPPTSHCIRKHPSAYPFSTSTKTPDIPDLGWNQPWAQALTAVLHATRLSCSDISPGWNAWRVGRDRIWRWFYGVIDEYITSIYGYIWSYHVTWLKHQYP